METRPVVGVVGLGTMGAGIVQVCAEAGFETIGCDLSELAGKVAAERIGGFLRRKAEKGQLTPEEAEAAIARVSTTTSLADLAGCGIVIEAAFEEIEVKRTLFRELEQVVAPDAILATNTSAIPVTQIASSISTPERVVGLHFFNPAPLMKLVEVVRAERTSDEVFERAFAFGGAIGKTPVRCHDTPGFVVNRTLIPLLNDCIRILDEASVSAEDLDEAIRLGLGWPMGPTHLVDLIGLDVHVHASEALYERLREPRMAPPPRLRRMVEAGKLGRKSGEGFHRYDA